jgi:hypothetical protein
MKRMWALAIAMTVLGQAAVAQDGDVVSRLRAAGADPQFAERVGEIVTAARDEGLPTGPIEEKAIEGWAKRHRVPPERVTAVLEQVRLRLREAHQIMVESRVELRERHGETVAAAAEALGRNMTREQVRELVQAAPTPEAAAAGLTVAASLVAQGLEAGAAVYAVRTQLRAGGPPERVYESPSAMADMRARGATLSDVAGQIMQGGGLPMPGGAGAGAGTGSGPNRPSVLPPSRNPTDPAGQPGGNQQPGGQGKKNQGGNG